MIIDNISGLVALALATSITPGPNNLMLMYSGARFGMRRTLGHWLGVSVGFALLAIAAGLGAGQALHAFPAMKLALQILCTGYLLWLAWRVATSGPPGARDGPARPLSFLQAVAFQWVNPKVWAMALSAMALYAPAGGGRAVLAVACVFAAVNFPAVGAWAFAGTRILPLLRRPGWSRAFSLIMAGLLLASLVVLLR